MTIKGYTTRGRRWEWLQSWHLLFFLTLYFYWAALLYMGLRTLQFRWIVYSFVYAGPAALYGLIAWAAPSGGEAAQLYREVQTYLFRSMLAFWMFALIHTFVAREEFLMRLAEDAEERDALAERIRARSQDGEPRFAPAPPKKTFDLNAASEAELAMLPGMGPERARQAVELRRMQGGFRSFSQFADQLQIPEQARERLRAAFDEDPDPAPAPADPAFRVLADGRRVLELNWAGVEALAALPGLGPETARRALALREGDGPFRSLEDFRYRVGLKPEAISRIEPYISVVSMSTAPGSGVKAGGRIVDV